MADRYLEKDENLARVVTATQRTTAALNAVVYDILTKKNMASILVVPDEDVANIQQTASITILEMERNTVDTTRLVICPTALYAAELETTYKTFSSLFIQDSTEHSALEGFRGGYGNRSSGGYGNKEQARGVDNPDEVITNVLIGIRWGPGFSVPMPTKEVWPLLKEKGVSWGQWQDYITKHNQQQIADDGLMASFEKSQDGKFWSRMTLLGGKKPEAQ